MGIYRQGKTFWVDKCINGIRYRKSAETTSKMEAKAFYDNLKKTLPILYRRNKSKNPNILKASKYLVGCPGIEPGTY